MPDVALPRVGTWGDALRARRATRGVAIRDHRERRSGCPLCAARVGHCDPPAVLPDELVAEWEIGRRRQRLYDAREGGLCPGCGASGRGRSLALALLEASGAPTGTSFQAALSTLGAAAVAEINEAKDLHRWLLELPGLAYSEYAPQDPSVRREDVEALRYPDASFRLVFCSDTLEHVPRPERALAELARVLEPGGAAVVTVPLLWHRPTRVRAERCESGVVHRLPPSFHGSRAVARERDGYLVYQEFGPDVIERFSARLDVTVCFLDLWRNPFECAFVLKRR